MADEPDKAEPAAPTCLADPNFAVICSFLEKFAEPIGLAVLPFTQLQEMLEDQDQVSQALIDLHVKLLRKARKSFTVDKWEKALTKFAHSYSQQDGWEFERFGYKKSSLGVKLRLLKTLLEAQFDINTKFKNDINKLSPQQLRIEPLGRDAEGLTYWCQFDPACNVRVYREDVDEETWDLVAQDRHGLVSLIDSLSSGEGQQELDLILNEEEACQENEKPVTDTGQDEHADDDDEEEEEEEEGEKEEEVEGEKEDEEEGEKEEEDEEEEKQENVSLKNTEKPNELMESNIGSNNQDKPECLAKKEIAEQEATKVVDFSNSKVEAKESTKMCNIESTSQETPAKGVVDKSAGAQSAVKPVESIFDATKPKEERVMASNIQKSEEDVKPVGNGAAMNSLNKKKDSANYGSIDLSVRALPPRPPSGNRPGSKLEEIFKKKIELPVYPYQDEKTSILSQMAARFNNVDNEVQDLSMVSSKRPRLDQGGRDPKNGSFVSFGFPKPDPVVGEAIEENVMIFRGEGSGAECNAGNPVAEHDSKKDNSLEVVAVFNASSEEAVREGIRDCIIRDAASTNGAPISEVSSKEEHHYKQSSIYTHSELSYFDQIRLVDSNTDPISSLDFTVSPSDSKEFVFEASEVIEEDVMYFSGCGAGHNCDTGNPGESTSEKPSTSNDNNPPEKKGTKKLWSIDTICKSDDSKSTVESIDSKTKQEDKSENGPNSIPPVVENDKLNNKDGMESVGKEPLSVAPVEEKNKSGTGEENGQKDVGDDQGKSAEVEDKGKKSVFISNIIEVCLNNKPTEKDDKIDKEVPSGFKYEDLFSAKNILPPNLTSNELRKKESVPSGSVEKYRSDKDDSLKKQDEIEKVSVKTDANKKLDAPKDEEMNDATAEQQNLDETDEKCIKLGDKTSETDEMTILDVSKDEEMSGATADKLKSGKTVDKCITFGNKTSRTDAIKKLDVPKDKEINDATSRPEKSDETDEKYNKLGDKTSETDAVKKLDITKDKKINDATAVKGKMGEMDEKCIKLGDKTSKTDAIKKVNVPKDKKRNAATAVQKKFGKADEKFINLGDKTSKTSEEPGKNATGPSDVGVEADNNGISKSDKADSKSTTLGKEEKFQESMINDREKGEEEEPRLKEPNKKSEEAGSIDFPTKNDDISIEHQKEPVLPDVAVEETKPEAKFDKKDDRRSKSGKQAGKGKEKRDRSRKGVGVAAPSKLDVKEETKLECQTKTVKSEIKVEHVKIETDNVIESKSRNSTKPGKFVKDELTLNDCEKEPSIKESAARKTSIEDAEKVEEDTSQETATLGEQKPIKEEAKSEIGNKVKISEKIAPVVDETSDERIDKLNTETKEGGKPKGRKSRTNSLNEADEVPSKVRKTNDGEAPKEVGGRRASRRSTRTGSMNKPMPKEDPRKTQKKEPAKTLTLSTFSLEPEEEALQKPSTTKKDATQTESTVKGGKRKRDSTVAEKSEEEGGTEEEESKAEEEEVGGKKPRLKAKVKKGGKRKRGRGGFRGFLKKSVSEETKEDAESKEDSKDGKHDEASSNDAPKAVRDDETAKKTEDLKDSDDDVPLAKRGRPVTPKTTPKSKEDSGTVKKGRKSKTKTMLGLTDLDLKCAEVDKVEPDTPGGRPGRASRRIAMQKIKEEAERRAVEDAIKDIDDGRKGKKKEKKSAKLSKEVTPLKKDLLKDKTGKKKRRKKDETEEDEEEEGAVDSKKDEKKRRKKKGFKYNIHKPWASSSGSDDENLEEEEEDHLEFMGMEEEEDVRVRPVVSDHEFSCDEDLEKGEGEEALPVRRARTAVRKEKSEKADEEGKSDDEREESDIEDYKCEKCGKEDHPEWILLCDTCDKGYHASCLRPPIMLIPEGDWHCPPCQHVALVKQLKSVLRTFEKNTKRRDNEELRRKRLAYVGISLANVLPDGVGSKVNKKEKKSRGADSSSEGPSRSSSEESESESSEDSDDEPVYQLRQRRAAAQNYRFNDYDQLIDSAIQDEMVAAGSLVPGVALPAEVGPPVEGGVTEGPAENGEIGDSNVAGVDQAKAEGGDVVGKTKEDEEEEGDISKSWRPPVVPKRSTVPFVGRKKPKKLCNLDVESDDQNDSDEDFKGSSSEEEEEDYSGGSDESGDWKRRQPLRRSGRARQSRLDRDFINDSDSDDYGKKKKKKQEWDESSSSSSDQSWGRRKKQKSVRSSFSKAKSRSKKKKSTRRYDSDSDAPKKKPKPKKPKVRYGLSEDDDDGPLIKTRGKKMNYTEIHGSDTEEEERLNRIKGRKTLSDMEAEDEEFVLDKEEEEEFMEGHSHVRKAPRRISSGEDEEEEEEEENEEDGDESSDKAKPSDSIKIAKEEPKKTASAEEKQTTEQVSKNLPPASQPLPASRPKPPPTTLFKRPMRLDSEDEEEEEQEEDEEEELPEEELPEEEEELVEDEEVSEEEGESEDEKQPPRRIPPPIPLLRVRVPGQPNPPVALNSMQSKLKDALNAAERRPKESEALARLREKLANAAARPGIAQVAANLSVSTPEVMITPKSEPKPEEKEKQSPPPSVGIRVVNTQKLLAPQPQELLKRPQPESVIRGMLGSGPPPGLGQPPPMYFNRPQGPGRMIPAGIDPGRFMQRPSLHPVAHHLQHQQRRFPDRYMYGGGAYHGGGGYFPPAPGPVPFPPVEVQPVPPSDFHDGPLEDDQLPYQSSAPPHPHKSEGSGEFGGLVSYFSSQRKEDDLET